MSRVFLLALLSGTPGHKVNLEPAGIQEEAWVRKRFPPIAHMAEEAFVPESSARSQRAVGLGAVPSGNQTKYSVTNSAFIVGPTMSLAGLWALQPLEC